MKTISDLRELVKVISNQNKDIILYGNGIIGKTLHSFLKKQGVFPICFAISSPPQRAAMDNLAVFHIDSLAPTHCDCFVLVTTQERHHASIAQRLENLRFTNIACINERLYREIYAYDPVLAEMILLRHEQQLLHEENQLFSEHIAKRFFRKPSLDFNFHICDSCNLNCRGCIHFSPLAEKDSMANIDEFEKDIERVAQLFGNDATSVTLLGGEPLLNPDAYKFPYIIREYLKNTHIDILTNATLINQQDDRLWASLRNNNVCLKITRYPIKMDFEEIKNTLDEQGIRYGYINLNDEDYSLVKTYLDVSAADKYGQEGKKDARLEFLKCPQECIHLRKGKLYPCATAAYSFLFEDFFKTGLQLSEFDGIDIHKAPSREAVLDFLAQPIPFCRYCAVEKNTYGHKWGVSRRELSEWT